MVCKMLFFDYRDSEKLFFEKNKLDNYDIKFFTGSLNKKTVRELSENDLVNTTALNIYIPSILSEDVIKQFKNLRVIVTRSEDVKHINLKTCLERNIAVVNVEMLPKDYDYRIVQKSFEAVTSVLCGCKEYRVV
ncbi:hypothetical protein J6N69_05730 [bacterium]|nr:hypothetical protein [bacterium]MBP3847688.1 hypothetical protein [bacterium]